MNLRNVINTGACLIIPALLALAAPAGAADPAQAPALAGNRFFTFVSVIRVNQIEVSRDRNLGADEAKLHTPEAVRDLRDNLERAFPGARMTWALSWLALQDPRENYRAIRAQVVDYQKKYGDEVTFIPGAYFAPMHNSREQVNRDLHDGLKLVSEMVGGGYRPKCVIGGFLAAENLRYLAEQENIHVAQGTIWSSCGIDYGDGDGSISYPYYPSREHYCKPAQQAQDFIDCVCLDGWTCDFLCARREGVSGGFNSRLGLGPIESLMCLGPETGLKQQIFTTAIHFDDGFKRNGFAWVTAIWELCLGVDTFRHLPAYGAEVRRRWGDVRCITEGEFGEMFRKQHKDNKALDYRFTERGSGIGGSDKNLEIRWFMNQDFRLALLRDWTQAPDQAVAGAGSGNGEMVIDFTRYDLKAEEPQDMKRNWSLMNRINQKQSRAQDKPVALSALPAEDQAIIRKKLPELFAP